MKEKKNFSGKKRKEVNWDISIVMYKVGMTLKNGGRSFPLPSSSADAIKLFSPSQKPFFFGGGEEEESSFTRQIFPPDKERRDDTPPPPPISEEGRRRERAGEKSLWFPYIFPGK